MPVEVIKEKSAVLILNKIVYYVTVILMNKDVVL